MLTDSTRHFSGDRVKVYVGPSEHLFVMPKSLLCHHSTFFKAALQGKWKEAEKNAVCLREESVETFQLLRTWMYTDRIDDSFFKIDRWEKSDFLDVRRNVVPSMRLYVLADKLGIAKAMETAAITFEQFLSESWSTGTSISPEALDWVYENTGPSSRLRQAVKDSVLRALGGGEEVVETYKSCIGSMVIWGLTLRNSCRNSLVSGRNAQTPIMSV